jgi:hypothetical protein
MTAAGLLSPLARPSARYNLKCKRSAAGVPIGRISRLAGMLALGDGARAGP